MTVRVVLLGAGHAHIGVLRAGIPSAIAMTLITRERWTAYSGRVPGLLRGECGPADARIDAAALAERSGAMFIDAEAMGIDLSCNMVSTGAGPVGFDLLSIDVGAAPRAPAGTLPLRPLEGLGSRLPDAGPLTVVGGGAAAVELALALARRRRSGIGLTLVSRPAEPPAGAPPGARRLLARELADAGVAVIAGVSATGSDADGTTLSDARRIAGPAIWANGGVAPGFLAASGLACDPSGRVRVSATLRSVSHPAVFAAGDCAALAAERPKSGVWAVRAGPVLADNLFRTATGRALRPWHPQRTAWVMLGVGGGRAVAWRGRIWVAGRWVWRWKDRIDGRWLAGT